MLTLEQNEFLTGVGPGTPGGELLRRYWHPVAAAQELTPEDPTKFVRILSEDLVLFRDRSRRLGLVAKRCAHRLMDLQFGIPEEERTGFFSRARADERSKKWGQKRAQWRRHENEKAKLMFDRVKGEY